MRLFYSVARCFTHYSTCRERFKYLNLEYRQTVRYFASLLNEHNYINFNHNSNPELPIYALTSQHKENTFSHQVMESRPHFNVLCFPKIQADLYNVKEVVDVDQVLSDPNLVNLSREELFNIFKLASVDAATKSLKPISDEKYNNLCHTLEAKVPEFDDDDIGALILHLGLWPMSESSRANNFSVLWKRLDAECIARMRQWSFDKVLHFIDLWYHLKLTRLSNYVYKSINVFNKKINKLTSQQVVQVLFYLNTIRAAHKGITMYNFEHKLEGFVDQMSIEEIGVAALGFFKTHTSLKNEELLKYIINRTIDEIGTVPEITLASILKCLRLSMQIKVWRELPRLLDAITPHLNRFTLQCLTHVALLTAPSQTLHPSSLDHVSQRLIENIKESRLKDMEKVLFPLSRLDYSPNLEMCVYSTVVDELSLPARQKEIDAFPTCFIALLHCLTLRSIFPQHLIAKALDKDFILKTYGPRRYHYGRELAFIDTCLELECKDYNGPRLPSDTRSYLFARYSHYAPNTEYKMTRHANFSYDVFTAAQALLGKHSAKFIYTVPSHPRPDIVIRPGGLPEEFLSRPDYEGPVHPPSGGETTCLVIVSKNMICPNVNLRLNGETISKLRSISILGYKYKLILYNEWPINGSLLDKEQFLEKIISSSDT